MNSFYIHSKGTLKICVHFSSSKRSVLNIGLHPFKSLVFVWNIYLSSDYQQETFYFITAASHIVPPWR